MAKKSNLATVLKADLATNIPLKILAEMIRSQGRGRDTVLAHITPREAAKLKREGGSGTTNPVTGLPEFEEIDVTDVPATPSIDATEEELRAYAERHPLVRQMLRTFRGKIGRAHV